MRIKHFITLLVLFSSLTFSQTHPYELHKELGFSISKSERDSFYLFVDLLDSITNEVEIFNLRDSFYLLAYQGKDTTYYHLTQKQIENYRINVEKLNAYYKSQSNIDSINLNYECNMDLDFKLVTKEQQKKMEKDSRRYQHLNRNADRQGLHGVEKDTYIATSSYGEFPKRKKK